MEAGAIAGLVVSMAASAALTIALAWIVGPTDIANYADRLRVRDVQTSSYGLGIPILIGQARLAGNIIWQSKVYERAVTTTESISGGILKPSSTISNTTYLYSQSAAIALVGHQIDPNKLTRIWADDVLIFDRANPKSKTLAKLRCTVYPGSETQLPSPLIESIDGVGTHPAYRGLAYVTFARFPLEKYGNRLPRFMFELEGL